MSLLIDAAMAIEWTRRFVAVYILLDSAEKLYKYGEFNDEGMFSWKAMRKSAYFRYRPKSMIDLLSLIFGYHTWLSILLLRLFIALGLILVPLQGVSSVLILLILFIIGLLINLRNAPVGAETENRLGLMLIGALFLRGVAPTVLVTNITLWFIALQSCLSYSTAGITKLFNKSWRNGLGIFDIVNSPNLVLSAKPAFFLKQHSYLGKFLTWASLGFECAFPLVLVIGNPFFILFLLAGVLFHLAVAFTLRYNKFFWVWIATYPAIIFIAQR